jgi:hypothetical protein
LKAGKMTESRGPSRLTLLVRLLKIGVGVLCGTWFGALSSPANASVEFCAGGCAIETSVQPHAIAMPRPSAMSPVFHCVTVYPLAEDVHLAIRKSGALSLKRWIAWDREALDAIDPESGRTPLMTALIAEKPKLFRILLESGAQPNLTDGVGNSALHVAAQINEPWHVLAMLKAGANPRLRNAQGQTFQRYLFMTPDKLLNSKTRDGMTAVINWLVANGIEVEGQSTAAARERGASGTTQ